MRASNVVFLCLLLVGVLPAWAGWREGGIVGVRDDNAKAPIALFLNTVAAVGEAPGAWHTLDVVPLGIPLEARAVFLAGLLIITHGKEDGICNLTLAFRRPGDELDPGNYIAQTIAIGPGSGQRSPMATWAPLKDGKVEWYWTRNTQGEWPDACSYAINLSAQAYVR